MQYDILSADNVHKLIAAIQEKINDGWKPLGGVAIKYDRNNDYYSIVECYYQTMTKDK